LKSNQSGDNKTAPESAGLPNGNGYFTLQRCRQGLPGGRFSNQKKTNLGNFIRVLQWNKFVNFEAILAILRTFGII
jgi:hypothetical protein